ncbi:hypothetical protein THOM_1438 [Trachipleistophora hominis]|uniref:Uncharacterized protein n=1 Tax=Trachipleistophora hominis TaxID=72359 RepID=L7JW74_TRAHO|nr:hypothetical protein THOM_1438 [Trachipleistophora hominis]
MLQTISMMVLEFVFAICSQFSDEDMYDSNLLEVQMDDYNPRHMTIDSLEKIKQETCGFFKIPKAPCYNSKDSGRKQENLTDDATNTHSALHDNEHLISTANTTKPSAVSNMDWKEHASEDKQVKCKCKRCLLDKINSLKIKSNEAAPCENINSSTESKSLLKKSGEKKARYSLASNIYTQTLPANPDKKLGKRIMVKEIKYSVQETTPPILPSSSTGSIDDKGRKTTNVKRLLPLSFNNNVKRSLDACKAKIYIKNKTYTSVARSTYEIENIQPINYEIVYEMCKKKIDKLVFAISNFQYHKFDHSTIIYTYFRKSNRWHWYFNGQQLINWLTILKIELFKLFTGSLLEENLCDSSTIWQFNNIIDTLEIDINMILEANRRLNETYKAFAKYLIDFKRISKGLLERKNNDFIRRYSRYMVSPSELFTLNNEFLFLIKTCRKKLDVLLVHRFSKTSHSFMYHNMSYFLDALSDWCLITGRLEQFTVTVHIYRAISTLFNKLLQSLEAFLFTYDGLIQCNHRLSLTLCQFTSLISNVQKKIVNHPDDTFSRNN